MVVHTGRKTQVQLLQEKIDIGTIVFIIACVYKCAQAAQLAASLPQLIASHTDTHPQASYHTVPTHRYISVIYYATSAKICDSWHSHHLHRL